MSKPTIEIVANRFFLGQQSSNCCIYKRVFLGHIAIRFWGVFPAQLPKLLKKWIAIFISHHFGTGGFGFIVSGKHLKFLSAGITLGLECTSFSPLTSMVMLEVTLDLLYAGISPITATFCHLLTNIYSHLDKWGKDISRINDSQEICCDKLMIN